jgi:hypothetical protein
MSVLFIDLIWGIIIGSIYYNIVLVISKRLQWKQQDHSRTNVG